jgi:hypothetical protein
MKECSLSYVIRNLKIKQQWGLTTHLLVQLKYKHRQHQMLTRMWVNRNPNSLMVEMKNGTATLEKILCHILTKLNTAFSHILVIIFLILTQMRWKFMYAPKLPQKCYSNFPHNCPKLEVTKMSLNKLIYQNIFKRSINQQSIVHSDKKERY